jgi:hypothetical protein
MRIETSAQGTSTAETVGDETKVDINVFAETLMTDATVASEVWIVMSKFILGWMIFVKLEMMY